MGYNTTVIVMNDSLDAIARDPNFGKNLAASISKLSVKEHYRYSDFDVPAMGHANAATAIETHHADRTAIVAVGQNMGSVMDTVWVGNGDTADGQLKIVQQLADKLGYRLVKKSKRTS